MKKVLLAIILFFSITFSQETRSEFRFTDLDDAVILVPMGSYFIYNYFNSEFNSEFKKKFTLILGTLSVCAGLMKLKTALY